MPIVQFHLVATAYEEAAIAALLEAASGFYVATLYPEMAVLPMDRVRAFVDDVAPDHWATAGQLVAQGGVAAPFFTCIVLAGRAQDQIDRLMAGMTDLIVRHLGGDRAFIRGRLIPVEPDHWFIGGVPASQTRKAEVAARNIGR